MTPVLDFVCDACSAIDWRRLTKRPSHSSTILLNHSLNSTLPNFSASPCRFCQSMSVVECPNDDGPRHHLVARGYRPHEYIYPSHGAAQLVMETAFQKCYDLKGGIRAIQRDDKAHAGLQVQPRINSKYDGSFRSRLRIYAQSDNRIYSLISKYLGTTAPNWNLFTIPGHKVIHMPFRKLTFEKDSINAFLGILHFHTSRTQSFTPLKSLPVYKS